VRRDSVEGIPYGRVKDSMPSTAKPLQRNPGIVRVPPSESKLQFSQIKMIFTLNRVSRLTPTLQMSMFFVVVGLSLLILDNMEYTDCCIMKMEQFSALNEQRFSVLRQTQKTERRLIECNFI
jgi:hypothetical protein